LTATLVHAAILHGSQKAPAKARRGTTPKLEDTEEGFVTDDRRIARRAAIELAVEYKRINTFFSDYTKNISRGGTFIRTDKPLTIGTEFIFALSVPNLAEPMRLRGRVKWVISTDNAAQGVPPGMGIEFIYRDAEERRAPEAVVEQLMSRELGETLSTKLLGKKPQA
jgi:type IV pilus assembly protein PilZ